MAKEILATNIDGFLIKHEAFIEPHKAWFDRAVRLTGDKSLEHWKGKKDYFIGVDKAMAKIMPQGTDEQRTLQARHWYQEGVVKYIKEHPQVVYKNVTKILRKLKKRFTLALVTVNTREYIQQILEAAGIENLYDIVYAIPASEKPDKAVLFRKFVKKYGPPKYYVAARSKEAFKECLSLGSLCVYASWDEFDKEIADMAIKIVKTPEELEVFVRDN